MQSTHIAVEGKFKGAYELLSSGCDSGAVDEHAGHTGLAWCVKSAQISEFPSWQYPCYTSPSKARGRKPNSSMRTEPFPSFFPVLLSSCCICCDQGVVGLCIWCLFSCGVSHTSEPAVTACHVLLFHTSSKQRGCAKGSRAWEQLGSCTWYKERSSLVQGENLTWYKERSSLVQGEILTWYREILMV